MTADDFRHLVRRFGRDATVEQTFNAGIRHWVLRVEDEAVAGVAYAVSRRLGRRVWMAAGGPICAPERLAETARAWEAAARAAHARPAWFGVDRATVEALGADHAAAVVGAEAVWDPAGWAATVDGRASLRSQVRRAGRQGVTMAEEPAEAAARDPGVADVLAFWLTTRGMAALGFLADPHILDRVGDRRAFVARLPAADEAPGRVVGALWLSPIPARDGWLAEWIWRGRGAPNGVTDGLLDAAARTVAAEGAQFLTLGMVPLSSASPASDVAPARLVRLLFAWTRAHARRFYRFDGLERFKAKYRPDAWEPLYLVARGRRVGITTLAAVADVFAGPRGPVRLVLGALARAVADEARTLQRKGLGKGA